MDPKELAWAKLKRYFGDEYISDMRYSEIMRVLTLKELNGAQSAYLCEALVITSLSHILANSSTSESYQGKGSLKYNFGVGVLGGTGA